MTLKEDREWHFTYAANNLLEFLDDYYGARTDLDDPKREVFRTLLFDLIGER